MARDMEIPTRWSEKQVRDYLNEFPASYQNIKLPYGLETGGGDRTKTLERILPADMTGKTLLDIGSANGFFCFEALKRGASRAKGIELAENTIRQSRLLADCLQSAAEFEQLDIDVDNLTEQFDYVLCLNVLHHMKNPLNVLEKLISITREKLIVEVATPGAHDRRKLGLGIIEAFFLRRASVIFVDRLGRGRTGQKFFISPRALENILMTHRRVFATVRTEKSTHKDRFIVTAEKRRIRRMLVVAGPTSVGKSTFIQKLQNGEFPECEETLGVHNLKDWNVQTGGSLINSTEAELDAMIFHYDFMHVHFRSEKIPARDPLLDGLHVAEELTFITLLAPEEVLLKRIYSGEIEPNTKRGKYRGNKRHLAIRDIYQSPGAVAKHYRGWLEFAKTKSSRHYVMNTAGEQKLTPLEEWESRQTEVSAASR
jgi:2-polyprenyl-3-methyl-5-hydroxy-6-metoxy-1,4-benzoquinol methylase